MSYREDASGQVVLTMSRDDYELLLMALGTAAGASLQGQGLLHLRVMLPLLNRINEGNPNFTPYRS